MTVKRKTRPKVMYTEDQKSEIKKKYEGMMYNLNAEKYTLERATDIFIQAIELTNKTETRLNDKSIQITCKAYDFIGEIAAELNLYKDIFIHLLKRFPELKTLDNELHTRLEQNCYTNSKKGNIKEGISIVNLKSNYRWTDRTQIDLNAERKNLQDLFPDIPEGTE